MATNDRVPTVRQHYVPHKCILNCLSQMELFIFNEDHEDDLIPERIIRLADEFNDRHRYRVIDWQINHRNLNTGIYQNIIYHMIPWLEFPSDVEDQLITVLLGENEEFLIPGECIFTEEVSELCYRLLVEEHLAAWRDGYFEPEDLNHDDLVWHNEFVEFAKNNGMM